LRACSTAPAVVQNIFCPFTSTTKALAVEYVVLFPSHGLANDGIVW